MVQKISPLYNNYRSKEKVQGKKTEIKETRQKTDTKAFLHIPTSKGANI
jgi:hypothetical protein